MNKEEKLRAFIKTLRSKMETFIENSPGTANQVFYFGADYILDECGLLLECFDMNKDDFEGLLARMSHTYIRPHLCKCDVEKA